MKKAKIFAATVSLTLTVAVVTATALAASDKSSDKKNPPKAATEATRKANAAVQKELSFNSKQDFDDAQRGFVATLSDLIIKNSAGVIIENLEAYSFLKQEKVPDTVNPSTWRQAQLNAFNGLFKVIDRVYQIRGLDLSNMTIIEGDSGLILIDPLLSAETAKLGLELYFQHRPQKPIAAVIYTHSHVDHYSGVKGVISEAEVKAGKVKIIAPEGFLEEAISENVYAGNAMTRRAIYMYGNALPPGPQGQVGTGLGQVPSTGTKTLIPPTDTVKKTGETREIAGIKMEFQMAPDTEAPAEFLIYFPQFKLLNLAEDATHTLHNIYTLRGAQVRDAKKWWKTLNEALERYGDKTDTVVAQHHWPTWGNEQIIFFIQNQRDMYKYLHDQTLNLANKGFTPVEIAEQIKLPDSIGKQWYNRGYYGSVNHNSKAIYQFYLGWYDSNPAHLYPLPPEESAKRYVKYMGGAKAILKEAKKSFAEGDYRWVAEVMNHVVFAEPNNQEARNLAADALEQLGYQAENATWRSEFLSGALELRHGTIKLPDNLTTASPDTVHAMTPSMLLDFMGIRLNGPKSNGKSVKFNWNIADESGKTFGVELRNSALIYSENTPLSNPDATLTAEKDAFASLVLGEMKLDDGIKSGKLSVEGNKGKIDDLLALLDNFSPNFNIVLP